MVVFLVVFFFSPLSSSTSAQQLAFLLYQHSDPLLPLKFPNDVILDETVPDQVRFHRVISVGIKVLATLTRIDGDFFLET
jgi:hypothetical protein